MAICQVSRVYGGFVYSVASLDDSIPCSLPVSVIRDMIRLEKSLDECLEHLKNRCSKLHVEIDMSDADDLDSIASSSTNLNAISLRRSSVRFGHHSEIDRLNKKLFNLENENQDLRTKLKELERILRSNVDKKQDLDEEKNADGKLGIGGEKTQCVSE